MSWVKRVAWSVFPASILSPGPAAIALNLPQVAKIIQAWAGTVAKNKLWCIQGTFKRNQAVFPGSFLDAERLTR